MLLFVLLWAVPALVAAAAIVRLRAAERDRRFLRAALGELGDAVVVCGRDGIAIDVGGDAAPTEVVAPLRRALSGECVEDAEVVVPKPGGNRHLQLTGAAVRDGRGRVLGAVMSSVDVTDRRRAEDDLRDYARSLRAVSEAVAAETSERDGREAICRAVADVAGAHLVVLWEPDGRGELVVSARIGAGLDALRLPDGGGAPAGAVRCFGSGRPEFVADVASAGDVHADVATRFEIASALLHPVRRGGRTVGVLAIGWPWPVPALSERVAAAVEVVAREAAGVIERGELLELLRAESRTDALTGLPNRRSWDEELAREMARATRHGYPLSVGLADLDHFKAYNDRLGHQAGDRLLRGLAAAWRGALREVDHLARWGGEEFAVSLPNSGGADAGPILDRLRRSVPDGQSCSVGVVTWDGRESAVELMARADANLYAAKQGGRDRVVGP